MLTAPATHAGDTVIIAGTLQFGSGELPDAFDVTVDGAGDVWDLNGVSDAIDGLFGAGDVLLGGGTLTVGSADGDGDFSGAIQESGAFVKTGSGVQILSGANTYTASTTIDEGVLEIVDNSSLGNVSAALIFNDGTLRSTTTFSTGRTTTTNSSATFDVAPATTLTFTSPISGNGELIKINDGVLELTQSNSYQGITQIDEGTLRLSGAGQLADVTDVSVSSGATFDLTNISDAIDSLTGEGNVFLGTGTLTIGANNGGGEFSGAISGTGLAGTIVKEGTGTAIFSGANAYAGGTSINGGVLQIGLDVNLGAPGGQVSFNTGTLSTTGDITTIREMSLATGGGTIDVLASTTLDAGGNISGAGALTKIGDGTLELGGISSYASTNILGGVLSASFNNNLGTALGPLNIDGGTLRTTNVFNTSRLTTIGPGGATFDVESVTLTHNGIIQGNSGANALTKIGAGTMQLTGVNTFIAPIQLNAGTLQVNLSNQLGNAANIISFGGGTLATTGTFANPRPMQLNPGGGTINVLTGTTLTQSGVIGDGTLGLPGPLAKTGSGTLLLTAANTFSSPVNIQGGILRLLGAGRLPDTADVNITMPAAFDLNNVSDAIDALSGDGDVLLGAGTLTFGASDGDGTFAGIISGAGGLVKIGAGRQTLQTKTGPMGEFLPNTYQGGTAINAGVLRIENDGNLGNPAGAITFNGGELEIADGTLPGSLATSRAVTLQAGGGTIDTIQLTNSATFSGTISGVGSLTKKGLGVVTLSAANTYTGDTVIDGGVIRLNNAGRLPDASNVFVNVATLGGGGTAQGLQLNNINDAINGLNGTGEVDLGSGTLTVGSAGAGGSFTGFIEGTGGFVKTGAGTQILGGNNTYSGGTTINGGVLQIAANNNLGNVSGGLSFNGGTLRTTASFSTARATTLNAGGGTFDTADATTLTHTGQISGVGGLGKNGPGTLLLSIVNIYGGATTVSDGTLRITASERLPNTTSVTVNSPGVFDLNNNNETIDGLSGSGAVQIGTAQLTVGISDGSGNFSGVISGSGDFQKEGAGTQTLSGQHTYSGATVVNGGQLILHGGGSIDQATLSVGFNNGSDGTTTVSGAGTTWDLAGNLLVGVEGDGRLNIDDTAIVTVGGQVALGTGAGTGSLLLSGGTLDNSTGTGLLVLNGIVGGSGTILADIVNQDTLAPGNSAGILNVTGTYVQETTGVFAAEVGGTGSGQFDVLSVSSTASLAGDLELSLLGYTPSPADTFAILTAGSLVGSFANVNNGARLNISSGGTGSFQVNYGPGSSFGANQVVLSDFLGTATFTADFDNDGDVDGADLAEWQAAYGLNSNADADGDNDSDGRDFLAWQRQFGSGLPLTATQSTVPEPSGLMLSLLVVACSFLNRQFNIKPVG